MVEVPESGGRGRRFETFLCHVLTTAVTAKTEVGARVYNTLGWALSSFYFVGYILFNVADFDFAPEAILIC